MSFGLGVIGSDELFDLVVSGINRGANVGNVSHLSGTVGAAMRAHYLGVPSIAASQASEDLDTLVSARFIARLVDRYRREVPPEGTLVSVNVPAGESRGVRIRPMGESYLAGNP